MGRALGDIWFESDAGILIIILTQLAKRKLLPLLVLLAALSKDLPSLSLGGAGSSRCKRMRRHNNILLVFFIVRINIMVLAKILGGRYLYRVIRELLCLTVSCLPGSEKYLWLRVLRWTLHKLMLTVPLQNVIASFILIYILRECLVNLNCWSRLLLSLIFHCGLTTVIYRDMFEVILLLQCYFSLTSFATTFTLQLASDCFREFCDGHHLVLIAIFLLLWDMRMASNTNKSVLNHRLATFFFIFIR